MSGTTTKAFILPAFLVKQSMRMAHYYVKYWADGPFVTNWQAACGLKTRQRHDDPLEYYEPFSRHVCTTCAAIAVAHKDVIDNKRRRDA